MLERGGKGIDQIVAVLEADRRTYQSIYNADAVALDLFDIGMGHRDRMRDQRLHGTEVFGA